jgi:hypothetical protein
MLGWRQRRGLLGTPQHPNPSPHLGKSLAPGLLHDEQRLTLALLFG